MRGADAQQSALVGYLSPEEHVPADYPLRPVGWMVDETLPGVGPWFQELQSPIGRPGIAPERLLCALLLQVLCTIRSVPFWRDQVGV